MVEWLDTSLLKAGVWQQHIKDSESMWTKTLWCGLWGQHYAKERLLISRDRIERRMRTIIPTDNSEALINQTCMFLDYGRKLAEVGRVANCTSK